MNHIYKAEIKVLPKCEAIMLFCDGKFALEIFLTNDSPVNSDDIVSSWMNEGKININLEGVEIL